MKEQKNFRSYLLVAAEMDLFSFFSKNFLYSTTKQF